METSFGILLAAFALSFVATGASWAHLALGVEQRMYRERELIALGIPALAAFALSLVSLVLPPFDVAPTALVLAAALCGAAVLAGFRATTLGTVARSVLWPAAAMCQAWGLTQAIGIA